MSSGIRVLVVDDDNTILEMIQAALSFEGHEVCTASRGGAALDLAREFGPDLILLDMRMPEMDGRQFSLRYHETPGPRAPIVFLTADRDMATMAAELGADGHLAKPFDLLDLLTTVERFASRG